MSKRSLTTTEIGARVEAGTATRARARRLRRAVAAGLGTVAAVALMAAPSAQAAATTGSISTATCGWHLVDGPGGGEKITTAALPRVSGLTSAAQLVWLEIEFMHPQNGSWVTYRTGWFSTYVRAGVWSTNWTSYSNGRSGYTTVDDAPGESGYLNSWTETGVRATADWYNAGRLVGAKMIGETNPSDAAYGTSVCNGGPNYA